MKLSRIAVATVASMCLTLPVASGAAASPAPTPVSADSVASKCKGASKKTVAVTYHRGPGKVLLRCGTKSWGYKHLVAKKRWSSNFSKKVGQAIWSGKIVTDVPGERTYERHAAQCPPKVLMRVVTNPGAYGKDKRIKPQGVVTAYKPTAGASTAAC